MAKKEQNIKSKGWKELLTGMEIEQAGLRVQEKSQVSFGTFEKQVDSTGTVSFKEVKSK